MTGFLKFCLSCRPSGSGCSTYATPVGTDCAAGIFLSYFRRVNLKTAMAYWLIKSEPFKYSWEQLEKDGQTYWDGVRNYAARNNLRAMQKGDLLLFYHSNEGLEIVGIARVVNEAYPDPTTDEDAWVVVDVRPVRRLARPVSLKAIKAEPRLKDMALLRLSRLSVQPVTEEEYNIIMEMAGML